MRPGGTQGRKRQASVELSRSLLDGPHGGRRRFVQGLALGGIAMGLDLHGRLAIGAPVAAPRELSGSQLVLDVGELPVDFTGRRRLATVVNGLVQGYSSGVVTISVAAGDFLGTVDLTLTDS